MKIYCTHDGELCEVLSYSNMRSTVIVKSPNEGTIKVEKRTIEIVGFKNGKGDTGELKILR